MNLFIEIRPVVFGTMAHKTVHSDTIKKVRQLCFGGHLMTMIKDIFKKKKKKKGSATFAFFMCWDW